MGIDERVLIVGAGPVGLFAALWLAKLGVDVRIVERRASGSVHSKALGVHANTIELLQRLDIAGSFLDAGLKMRRIEMRSSNGSTLAIDFTEIDSPYNFVLILEQARTEAIFRRELESHGVEVCWNTEVVGLTQDDAHCTVEYSDGSTSAHEFVVGCDGGRSTVRDLVGIAFDGEKHALWFALCDARLDWDERPDESRGYLADDGLAVFFPLPERPWYRMVATLPDRPEEEAPQLSDAMFQHLASSRAPVDVRLEAYRWQSSFQIRRGLAERYRDRRVFLAGDAAHTHSPVGGQGMNTGLCDAANLCWKIAAVLRDEAPETWLDTYESERRPVARSTVFTTQMATDVGATDWKIVQRLRDHMMNVGASIDAIRGQIAKRGSMTEFSYSGPQFRQGSLVSGGTEWMTDLDSDTPSVAQRVDFARGPRPGHRAPDLYVDVGTRLLAGAGPRHILLLFDGSGPTTEGYEKFRTGCEALRDRYPWIDPVIVTPHEEVPAGLGEVARIVHDPELTAHERYAAMSEAAYLVRPDNYIAWRGQPASFDELSTYLADVLGS